MKEEMREEWEILFNTPNLYDSQMVLELIDICKSKFLLTNIVLELDS